MSVPSPARRPLQTPSNIDRQQHLIEPFFIARDWTAELSLSPQHAAASRTCAPTASSSWRVSPRPPAPAPAPRRPPP
eukprot:1182223-Prorocentrum_minimum.AAC.1